MATLVQTGRWAAERIRRAEAGAGARVYIVLADAASAAGAPVPVLSEEVVQAEPETFEHHAHMRPVLEGLDHAHAVPADEHAEGQPDLRGCL